MKMSTKWGVEATRGEIPRKGLLMLIKPIGEFPEDPSKHARWRWIPVRRVDVASGGLTGGDEESWGQCISFWIWGPVSFHAGTDIAY